MAIQLVWYREGSENLVTNPLTNMGTTLSSDTLNINQPVVIADDLNVLGATTVDTLTAIDRISVGLISLDGTETSLNALGSTLSIQNKLGSGDVDFFNGRLVMTTKGDITTHGEITAVKYNIDTTNTKTASAGVATIPAGQTSISIYTSALTTNSLVFVTPEDVLLTTTYSISGSDEFIIKINAAQSENVRINWWIIN